VGTSKPATLDVFGEAQRNVFDALSCFDGGRAGDVRNQPSAVREGIAQVSVAVRQGLFVHA
jgi:hypothetical protein